MIRVNSFVCGGVLGGFVGVGDDGALDWMLAIARNDRAWLTGVANGRVTGLLRVFVPQRSQ